MSERVQMTVCPDCCGAKLIDRFRCEECRGNGVVPADRLEWRMIGEHCRIARNSIHATLAEAAFYLGVKTTQRTKMGLVDVPYTMADVAAMEAGYENPDPLYRHWFKGVA